MILVRGGNFFDEIFKWHNCLPASFSILRCIIKDNIIMRHAFLISHNAFKSNKTIFVLIILQKMSNTFYLANRPDLRRRGFLICWIRRDYCLTLAERFRNPFAAYKGRERRTGTGITIFPCALRRLLRKIIRLNSNRRRPPYRRPI